MDPSTVGILGLGILIALMLLGLPIGAAMALVGFTGFAYLRGIDAALWQLSTTPFSTFSSSYVMSVIPMFILMGEFCFRAGISDALYRATNTWIGSLPGGLAMATVAACAAFSAVSGSSLATAATMAVVALPAMRALKYDDGLATASVAAGGTLGILIPPSINLVIYGIIAQQSIGELFLAGFLPGVLAAFLLIAAIYIQCKLNPALGPKGPKTTLAEKIGVLPKVWPVLLLFTLVMGGLYLGIVTPTEAGAIGAFGAFVIALGSGKLTVKSFFASLIATGKTTAFILFIIFGTMMFGYFLAVSRLPDELVEWLIEMQLNRYTLTLGIVILYIVLGMFIETLSIMLLTVPILLPLVQSAGFDPIWFGILITRLCEIGLITPPVGLNIFIVKGIAKDVPTSTIAWGLVPFIIADLIEIVLLVMFPDIALFLPRMMSQMR